MKHDTGCLQVVGDVIDGPATNDLAKTEDSLRPGDLGMEQLGTDRCPFSRARKGRKTLVKRILNKS